MISPKLRKSAFITSLLRVFYQQWILDFAKSLFIYFFASIEIRLYPQSLNTAESESVRRLVMPDSL